MNPHIIEAVISNAAKHEHRHGMPVEGWDQPRDLRYLRTLIEEVGELASALAGKHEHPMELEVIQIAGICLNWLNARGTTDVTLHRVLDLDDRKHAAPGIALERWVYRFQSAGDAVHFHDVMEVRGEPSEWIAREVRTPLAPHAAFPLWHEICRSGGYGPYLTADKVVS